MPTLSLLMLLSSLTALGQENAAEGREAKPPNILLILCDDMGWRDLSCFGNARVATPNVDRLAAEGVKLTRFYAASAVCTPTRVSVLTGKYPLRFDVRSAFRDAGEFLPLGTTLPRANNGDLKGGKTDLHEGGIRVPFLARWPGHFRAGIESTEIGNATDLMPTCCAAAGMPLPAGETFDGRDLLPLLSGRVDALPPRTFFWQIDLMPNMQRHDPKPRPFATEAARRGKWKLLAFNGKPVELFDIEGDPREQINRLGEQPEVVEAIGRELAAWLAEPRQPFGKVD